MNTGVHVLTGVMREKQMKDISRTDEPFLLKSIIKPINKSIKTRLAETLHPTVAGRRNDRIDIPVPRGVLRTAEVKRSGN